MLRFKFSSTDHLNTNVSDEQGKTLYNVSTTCSTPGSRKTTTIKKCSPDVSESEWEVMGVIEWPRFPGKGLVQFDGRAMPLDEMFKKRQWHTGLFFVGPDQRTYKWKLSPQCWMKPADSSLELVRFHKKNLGIRTPLHPPYLDVSRNVVSMLDYIIFTFVYAESMAKLRREQNARQSSRSNIHTMNMVNTMNAMNTTNTTNTMNVMNMMNMMNTINTMNMVNTMNTCTAAGGCTSTM